MSGTALVAPEIAVQNGIQTEQIWADFHGRLLSFIRGRVAGQQDAEDILQDVFTRIHANIHRLKDAQSVTAWTYQITRNAIVDHYRTRAKDAGGAELLKKAVSEDRWPGLGDAGGEEERPGLGVELGACIAPLLRGLPEHYREAIELTELSGLTQKEAAARAELSVSGMKARVQRGRRKLKDLMLECCQVDLDRRGGIIDIAPRAGVPCKPRGCGGDETEE